MSTILKALRKLEEDQPDRQIPATPELDREIAVQGVGAESHPWRRIALVAAAVLLSGVAGVGVTLAGLSYWQASLFDSQAGAAVAGAGDGVADEAVAVEADADEAVVAPDRDEEEPTVVVVADVLARRAAALGNTRDSFALEMRSAERRQTSVASEAGSPTIDRVESLPLAIYSRKSREQDPASRLAAAREARVSRTAEIIPPPVARVRPAPVRSEPDRIASLRVEAPVEAAALAEISSGTTPRTTPTIARLPVPPISVLSTVWHPRPERRRVQLSIQENGETRTLQLREGDLLGPLKLSEIGPIGVTFVLEGVEIEHRVGGTHR